MKSYPHVFIGLAKKLRRDATDAERILWERLRDRRLAGLKFRRQHRIGRYLVDFYCPASRLVIELEGSVHDTEDQREYDVARFGILELYDLKVLRFKNDEIKADISGVLKRILETATSHPPTTCRA